jgi:lipoprotein NlpI
MNRSRFLLISIFIIILVSITLYGKTKSYDFVNFDDTEYVIKNPLINELSVENTKSIFSKFYFANYQPLVLLSYALEYKHFKLTPGAYHITNIILHTINSILVLLLLYLITKNSWISLIIALLFSIHPVQVESVAWVSERKGLMCAFFYLLAFMSYIRYSRKDKKSFYFLSIVLFLFSLLSKPVSVTFPLVLIIFDYYEEKLTKSKLIAKIPFFVISGVLTILIVLAQESRAAILHADSLPMYFKSFILPFHSILFYIGKLIVPINLSVHYGYPEIALNITKYFVSSIAAIILLTMYLLNFKKIKREINFGILFFLVTILPMMRFVHLGNTFAADRYMYIPMIGFFFAIIMLFKSFYANRILLKKGFIAAAVISFLCFGALNQVQCKVWRNSYTLWTNVLKTTPNHYNAFLGIGNYYMGKKDAVNARKYFSRVLSLEAGREFALYTVGLTYACEDNLKDAEKYFLQLVSEYPKNKQRNNTHAYMFLAELSVQNKNFDKAAEFYEKSLKLNPKNSQSHFGYANVMESSGRIDEAIKHHKLAIKFNKNWGQPKKALARLTGSNVK